MQFLLRQNDSVKNRWDLGFCIQIVYTHPRDDKGNKHKPQQETKRRSACLRAGHLVSDEELTLAEINASVTELCSMFGRTYWATVDAESRYPDEFVRELSRSGWLSVLIPKEYGGGGLGIREACAVLQTINSTGANSSACHAQMYTMASLVRHGNEVQKQKYLPGIADGSLRLQAFAVTEPDAGSDTSRISTFARRADGGYVVNGRKIFISRVQHSDLMILLARTTPRDDCVKPTQGMSLFIVDLDAAGDSVTASPIKTMFNHETNEVLITDLHLGNEALIGEEGHGFRYLLDSLNAERILIAAECIGDGEWFCRQASSYASERRVFGKPIGSNQGVQFPIARAYAAVRAASLMKDLAADLFDREEKCGGEANMAKYLASEASWEAADACMAAFGGYGFAAEYEIERKFRETRLYRTAPVANNLILAFVGEHVLGMPKSY